MKVRHALLNHNFVVSLTLVRLHARLSCASPPASLTDESLMLRQEPPNFRRFYFMLKAEKILGF